MFCLVGQGASQGKGGQVPIREMVHVGKVTQKERILTEGKDSFLSYPKNGIYLSNTNRDLIAVLLLSRVVFSTVYSVLSVCGSCSNH